MVLTYFVMLLLGVAVAPSRAAWSTDNRVITHNGAPFVVKGIAMNGLESGCRVPLGLDRRPLSWHLDTMVANGLNALRLPVPFEAMADLSLPILCWQPEFPSGTGVGDVIQRFLDEAQKRSLVVVLDLHTIGGGITPFPWTDSVGENRVVDAWVNVMRRFGQHPALMGIEIKNEPHHECSTREFFMHCARVIRAVEPTGFKGIYFISGVQTNGGPWGGGFDMDGLRDSSLPSLDIMKRLVLNPHVYGPSVRGGQALGDTAASWEGVYGFVTSSQTPWDHAAVVVTEWGGKMGYDDLDYYGRWADWHVNTKGFAGGGFYWTFGPFSDDTGGLVDDSYNIIRAKMDTINRLDELSRRKASVSAPPRSNLRGSGAGNAGGG
jgi:endoglucanase